MSMELSSQRLQEYLRQVIDLEVQCQTADKAYQTCQMKSKGLGVPHVLNKPTKPMERKGILSSFIRGSLKDLVVAVLLWAVLMIVHTGISVVYQGSSFLVKLLGWLSLPIAWIILAGGIVWSVHCIHHGSKLSRKAQQEYSNQMNDYERQTKQYEQDCTRVSKEKELLPILQKDIQMLDDRRKKSVQLLDKYYALDIIKPKYRNLLCVATFLEYLENERCYTLTGPDGCYNKFEEERQRGIIIAQLTNISRQLEQIRKTQERVADALDEIQSNTSRLCEGVQGLNGKMDIVMQDQRTIAYYTEQAANDQRVMNNYVMMRDWINS